MRANPSTMQSGLVALAFVHVITASAGCGSRVVSGAGGGGAGGEEVLGGSGGTAGGGGTSGDTDSDGDGSPDSLDCEPLEPTSRPGLAEVCRDQLDNDCDGSADEGCSGTRCGIIDTDTLWEAGTTQFVGCSVYVQGPGAPVLTIGPGVSVEFARGAGLFVGNSQPGALVIDGASAPVTLSSAADAGAPGDWVGIYLGRNTTPDTVLRGAVVSSAGGDPQRRAAVWLSAVSEVRFEDVVIQGSAGAGAVLELESAAAFVDVSFLDNATVGLSIGPQASLWEFRDNVFTGNGEVPLVLPVTQVARLDQDSLFTGNHEDAIHVRGGFLAQSAVWSAPHVPFVVMEEIYVESDGNPPAVLTLPPGAELRFVSGVGLKVGFGGPGDLIAVGGTEPIVFRAQDLEEPGAWDGIFIGDLSTPATTLSHVVVEHAGGGEQRAAVYVYYAEPSISDSVIQDSVGVGVRARGSVLSMSGCEVRGMVTGAGPEDTGDGVRLEGGDGGFATWSHNTVTANAGHPLVLAPAAMHGLDDTSSYIGNGYDAIRVTGGTVSASAEWRGLDVPWLIDGNIYVQGSTSRPVVRVEDATLLFAPGAGLLVGTAGSGDLVIRRSLLTAATNEPTPGAWRGLTFGQASTADSLIDSSEIAFGGQSTHPQASGNVVLGPYTRVDITNNTLRGSAGYGIYCQAGCADHQGNISGNTFADNASGPSNP